MFEFKQLVFTFWYVQSSFLMARWFYLVYVEGCGCFWFWSSIRLYVFGWTSRSAQIALDIFVVWGGNWLFSCIYIWIWSLSIYGLLVFVFVSRLSFFGVAFYLWWWIVFDLMFKRLISMLSCYSWLGWSSCHWILYILALKLCDRVAFLLMFS